MINAFLDRGARPDADGVMCVSACLFQPNNYEQFVFDWETMLSKISDPPPPYFRAADFFPRGGIFRSLSKQRQNEIATHIPRIINKNLSKSVTVSFREKEFAAHATPELLKRFGSLNGLAFQLCLGRIGHWANAIQYTGPISYFIEGGDQDQADIDGAFNGMNSIPKIKVHDRITSWKFIEKGRERGLEAADYCAWHWNKYDADTLTEKKRTMRKDYHALIFPDSTKHDVYRFTGESIKELLEKAMKQPRLLLPPQSNKKKTDD